MPRAGFPADTYAVHSMAIGPYNLQRSGRIYGNREEQLSNKKKIQYTLFFFYCDNWDEEGKSLQQAVAMDDGISQIIEMMSWQWGTST